MAAAQTIRAYQQDLANFAAYCAGGRLVEATWGVYQAMVAPPATPTVLGGKRKME